MPVGICIFGSKKGRAVRCKFLDLMSGCDILGLIIIKKVNA